MNMQQYEWQGTAARATAAELDAGLRQHMLRVYNYMGLGLVVTGLVAFLVASTPAIYVPIYTTPLRWVAMLAPLAFIFFLSFRIHAISMSTAQAVFWTFCGAMGLSMGAIFLVYTQTSIARTFMITAVMFGAMSLYGYTTKADLSRFGSFLMMGLVGIIIASIVNIFLGSTALQFIVSVAGVLIFTGLTAWDTQRIKEEYAEHYDTESLNKMALMGALSLYLNFINIFQFLLSLTGSREE